MTKGKINIWIFLIIVLQALPSMAMAANSFFDQRYRGWLWFEEKEKPTPPETLDKNREFTREEMIEIKEQNEKFKEELELLKHVMIRYPDNIEHVRRYKEKEKIMLSNAMKLSHSFLMTNFLNPDIANQLEAPQNIYGRKALKENEEKQKSQKLKNLAKKVELFLFFQGDCNHCELLEKHLARFANIHGFKVEAVSQDGIKSKYFKTHTNKELIEQLQLKEMPTVIAVTNDSKIRFELARGAVSVADLEDSSLLMGKYLDEHQNIEELKQGGN
jgi:hypothetical protein